MTYMYEDWKKQHAVEKDSKILAYRLELWKVCCNGKESELQF